MTRIHRIARTAIQPVAVLLVIAAALASPFALAAVGKSFDLNWVLLSNIGQAYGAAAAVLSALAVVGVAVSVRYQARAMHQQRVLASQERLYDRLQMVAADPETYAPALSHRWDGMTVTDLRRDIFAQIGITNMWFGYQTGVITEGDLRGSDGLRHLFTLPSHRRYWTFIRADLLSFSNSGVRRFARIADDIFQQAVADCPIVHDPAGPTVPPAPRASELTRLTTSVAAVGLCVLAAGWIAGSRRR